MCTSGAVEETKVHGVHVLQGGDFGGLEETVEGEYAGDGAGMELAVGGVIAAAVRGCCVVVVVVVVVWQDDRPHSRR